MTAARESIARGLAVAGTAAFLGVLGYYLGQPGYTWTRLALFAVLGGLAILGTAGVIYRRVLVAAGGACGLILLGFWQAALWIYVFPVAGILVVASLLVGSHDPSNTPNAG